MGEWERTTPRHAGVIAKQPPSGQRRKMLLYSTPRMLDAGTRGSLASGFASYYIAPPVRVKAMVCLVPDEPNLVVVE